MLFRSVSLLSGVYRWVLGECGGVVPSFAVVCGVQHSGAAWPCPQRRASSTLASACTFVIGLGGGLRVHPDGDLVVAASIAVLTMPISASASFGGCGARIMVEITLF